MNLASSLTKTQFHWASDVCETNSTVVMSISDNIAEGDISQTLQRFAQIDTIARLSPLSHILPLKPVNLTGQSTLGCRAACDLAWYRRQCLRAFHRLASTIARRCLRAYGRWSGLVGYISSKKLNRRPRSMNLGRNHHTFTFVFGSRKSPLVV